MAFQDRLQGAFRNPLFHLGLGLMAEPNIGRGAQSGVQNYQQFLANDLNYQAAESQLQRAEEARRRLGFFSTPEGRQQLQQMGVPGFLAQHLPEQAVGFASQAAMEHMKASMDPYQQAGDYGILNKMTGEIRPFEGGGMSGSLIGAKRLKAEGYDASDYTGESWNQAAEAMGAGNAEAARTALMRRPPQRAPRQPPSVMDSFAFQKEVRKSIASNDAVRTAGTQVFSLINDPSASGSEQLAGLVTFVKVLDPDSVAREGEVNLAEQMGSLADRIQVQIDRVKKGALLGPTHRSGILQATQKIMNIAESERAAKLKDFERTAKAGGFNLGVALPQVAPFPKLKIHGSGEVSGGEELDSLMKKYGQ